MLLLASGCAGHRGSGGEMRPSRMRPVPASAHLYVSRQSGIADSLRMLVQDSVRWAQVWRQAREEISPPPLPAVNFERQRVVVAALGTRTSIGFAISIDSIDSVGDTLLVAVRRISDYNPGLTMAYPIDVVLVDGTADHVRFNEYEDISCR